MTRRICMLFLLLGVPAAAQHTLDLEGAAKPEMSFTKDIGHGLVFAVRPGRDGFDVRVELKEPPAGMSDNDLSRCVTPPFHGPNPTDIEAARFVGTDNQPLPIDQQKDALEGDIYFVTNAADNKKACDELEQALYGPEKRGRNDEVVMGTPGYVPPAQGHIWFHILGYKLDDLGEGKQAKIVSLRFEARIDYPKKMKK